MSRLSGGQSSISHDVDQRCQTQKAPGRSLLETFSDADFNERQKKLLRLQRMVNPRMFDELLYAARLNQSNLVALFLSRSLLVFTCLFKRRDTALKLLKDFYSTL